MTETHTPLPRPFCSGAAEVESESCGWRVVCQNPECATQGPWPTDCTEDEALTAWNTRAVNSHHRLVEALEAIDRSWTDMFSDGPDGDYGLVSIGDEHRELWRTARAALKEAGHG